MWWKNTVFRSFFLAAIIINAGSIAAVFLFRSFLPPVVPLFYGRPDGAAQLVQPMLLLIAPGVSMLITILNLLLSTQSKDIFLKKLLAVTAFIVSFISLITIVKIVLLVGFF
jgi:hypothetical protein